MEGRPVCRPIIFGTGPTFVKLQPGGQRPSLHFYGCGCEAFPYNGPVQATFDLLAKGRRPFLIVGGHALAAHGVVRQTIDVDCLIAADDAAAMHEVLSAAGYSESGRTENFVRYRHLLPRYVEIDVLLVDLSTLEKLLNASRPLKRGKHEFRVPALPHLIALKLHAIRNNPEREARDFGDIAELLRVNTGQISRGDLEELCRQFAPPGIAAKLLSLL